MRYLPDSLEEYPIYCVGIKGSGMTALVEIFLGAGARVSGSDVADTFYTDAILHDLNVPVFEGFDAKNVPTDARLIVYSGAYDPAKHPELVQAAKLGIPSIPYNQALGELSRKFDSSGVAGVHGKTSTAAMVGILAKGLGLKGTVLTGSGVRNFHGRCVFHGGDEFFVAETCEYRRHFLSFSPRRIVLTNVELDHTDYFRGIEDMYDAFLEYALSLPEGGSFIYCADDPGSVEVAGRLSARRNDLAFVPYGFSAEGPFRVSGYSVTPGRQEFSLDLFKGRGLPDDVTKVHLSVPGKHMVQNAAGALALVFSIYSEAYGNFSPDLIRSTAAALEDFLGTSRRSEVIGAAGGVTFIDDYAHHPTAIAATLEGFRAFYPKNRIVVSFMPHTYSRTADLLDDFAAAFGDADLVILHDIYASAREIPVPGVTGRSLYDRTARRHPSVTYEASHADAAERVGRLLEPGDVFVTMGAGDNWKLGRAVMELRKSAESDRR